MNGMGLRVDNLDNCSSHSCSKRACRVIVGAGYGNHRKLPLRREPLDSGENWVTKRVSLDLAFLRHGWYVDSSGKARRKMSCIYDTLQTEPSCVMANPGFEICRLVTHCAMACCILPAIELSVPPATLYLRMVRSFSMLVRYFPDTLEALHGLFHVNPDLKSVSKLGRPPTLWVILALG